MAGPRYVELANLIREKCRIKINDENRDKFVFSKEECLIILTQLTAQDETIKRRDNDSQFIKEVVEKTLKSLTETGAIDDHAG